MPSSLNKRITLGAVIAVAGVVLSQAPAKPSSN
jgi:hypothetical protein